MKVGNLGFELTYDTKITETFPFVDVVVPITQL